tara:strand:+ start:724 stop:1785 length:1062 start_codon:yes stop_codon:yes gene_type:complete
MNKYENSKIKGLSLVEILLAIVITSIMMAAMYTSYNVVNKSYSQVSEKAKISRSSRDLVSMLMRDIRMSGFRYYAGTHTISKFAFDTKDDTGEECDLYPDGMLLSKTSYLSFDDGFTDQKQSHNPIVIRKNTLGYESIGSDTSPSQTQLKAQVPGIADDNCCDQIQIVYEDFNQNNRNQPYQKFRITYFAEPVTTDGDPRFAVYKTVESWQQPRLPEPIEIDQYSELPCIFPATGSWSDDCKDCVVKEMVRDHIADMEFIPFDSKGLIIQNSSGQYPAPELVDIRDRLFDIRGVDIRLTFRSKDNFFSKDAPATRKRSIKGLNDRNKEYTDKYFRDSVIVSVNTRNIGGELFK